MRETIFSRKNWVVHIYIYYRLANFKCNWTPIDINADRTPLYLKCFQCFRIFKFENIWPKIYIEWHVNFIIEFKNETTNCTWSNVLKTMKTVISSLFFGMLSDRLVMNRGHVKKICIDCYLHSQYEIPKNAFYL